MRTFEVEIENRESVTLNLSVENGVICSLNYKVYGGYALVKLCREQLDNRVGKPIDSFKFLPKDKSTPSLLLKELFDKVTGVWTTFDPQEEICHCRKISRHVIDEMVVIGAHTPEKVKDWCSAGSGCGTCRERVQSIIDKRLR